MYEGSECFIFLPVLGIDCLLIINILLVLLHRGSVTVSLLKNNVEHLLLHLSNYFFEENFPALETKLCTENEHLGSSNAFYPAHWIPEIGQGIVLHN